MTDGPSFGSPLAIENSFEESGVCSGEERLGFKSYIDRVHNLHAGTLLNDAMALGKPYHTGPMV